MEGLPAVLECVHLPEIRPPPQINAAQRSQVHTMVGMSQAACHAARAIPAIEEHLPALSGVRCMGG